MKGTRSPVKTFEKILKGPPRFILRLPERGKDCSVFGRAERKKAYVIAHDTTSKTLFARSGLKKQGTPLACLPKLCPGTASFQFNAP
jgi:hypothetical protein